MTPEAALLELLARVGARHGAPALFSDHEFSAWPGAAVAAMKSQGLLKKAPPAQSAICPGCERECAMPVHVLTDTAGDPDAFIVCDKRSDINRVAVPLSLLEQWQASGDSIAAVLTKLLKLPVTDAKGADSTRWQIGILKGKRHSSHVVLVADGPLSLSLDGHSVALADVLTIEDNALRADKHALLRMLDGDVQEPSAGIGSPAWRKQRAKDAANVLHDQPGGSRAKQQRIREIWATGKYSSRDRCAEEECAALNMSYSAARRALRNTPDPR